MAITRPAGGIGEKLRARMVLMEIMFNVIVTFHFTPERRRWLAVYGAWKDIFLPALQEGSESFHYFYDPSRTRQVKRKASSGPRASAGAKRLPPELWIATLASEGVL
ncbi:hypothetical protein ZHAS_00002684 [Anopheles sinensis]|uniref:Uncharacterized protein n=1 Tax=Anopheles sinensis TaxID=74873 RepID=A0A084VCT5_ANOSI|nr:hypothetical protein ZHAS_00002684 [Anopheles sinensis]